MKQEIRQGVCVGANTGAVREERGMKRTELADFLKLKEVSMTREDLVKIEREVRRHQTPRLRAIRKAPDIAWEELLERRDLPGRKV